MSVPPPDPFRTEHVDVDGVAVNCAIGGTGPPVLMLVLADLRGKATAARVRLGRASRVRALLQRPGDRRRVVCRGRKDTA